jgi:hypothetical protein
MMFCTLVGRFCPFLQGVNERFILTVHVDMELEFSHMPNDLFLILGYDRKGLDGLEFVRVLPVAKVLSHLFFFAKCILCDLKQISSEFYCN